MPKSAEFIMRPDAVTVLIVEPYGQAFPATIQKLEEDSSIQVAECATSLEAVSLARRVEQCLIVCHVGNQEDLVKHITMLKLLNSQIRKKQIRTIVTSKIQGAAIASKLALYGCSEIMPEPVTEKTLTFKIERNVKTLANLPDGPREIRGGESSDIEKNADGDYVISKGAAEPKLPPATVKLVSALTLESDCWLLRNGGAKRIGGKWVVRLMGPGSTAGRWVEIASDDETVEDYWQWIPTDPNNDPYIKEEGAWVFKGQKPELQDDLWHFVGKSPELAFYFEGENYGSKIRLEEETGELQITRDSKAATDALPLIQASLDISIKHNKAAEELAAQQEEAKRKERAQAKNAAPPAPIKIKKDPHYMFLEPLSLESDCWLWMSRKPLRVANRWSIKLVGPGPTAGKWVEIEGPEETDQYWQWTPTNPENDPFIREEGAWIFRGSVPRFDNDRWLFVSATPELAFYYEGQSYGAKIFSDSVGNLKLAEDSEQAKKILPLIQDSQENVLRQKGDEENRKAETSLTFVSEDGAEARSEGGDLVVQSDGQGYGSVTRDEEGEGSGFGSVDFQSDASGNTGGYGAVDVQSDRGPEDYGTVTVQRDEGVDYGAVKTDDDSASRRTTADLHVSAEPAKADYGAVNSDPSAEKAKTLISPVGLAFLVAELACKKDLDLAALAQRFCGYVSASSAGMRTELWVYAGEGWSFAASQDGSKGECQIFLQNRSLGPDLVRVGRENGEDVVIVPVLIPTPGGGPINIRAALIISGPGLTGIADDYLKRIARTPVGIVKALLEEAAAKAA